MDTGFIYRKAGLWLQDNVRVSGLKSFTPPAITATIGSYQPSWMDMPIPVDAGMEAMSVNFKTDGDISLLGLFGFIPGSRTRAQVRRAYRDTDGNLHSWVDEFEGVIGNIVSDEHATSDKEDVGMTVTMNLSYYKLTVDGAEIYEIDPKNLIRAINGVNQLADEKSAMNL